MVEEIVNNIIEAEDKAGEIVKNAKEEAKSIVTVAQRASEARRAAFVKTCRARLDESDRQSVKKAEAVYEEMLKKGREEAAQLGEGYRKNIEKAAETVLAAITA